MSENRDFGFCPRCGALMQSGICQSCGYENRGQAPSPSQNPGWSQGVQGFQQTQNRQGYPGYPQVYVGRRAIRRECGLRWRPRLF